MSQLESSGGSELNDFKSYRAVLLAQGILAIVCVTGMISISSNLIEAFIFSGAALALVIFGLFAFGFPKQLTRAFKETNARNLKHLMILYMIVTTISLVLVMTYVRSLEPNIAFLGASIVAGDAAGTSTAELVFFRQRRII